MKKKINKTFQEEYYEEILDNGLKVLIFHKPEYVSSIAAIGTPYGALKIHERKGGKNYDFHPGIAHFLEHKLFETEDRDIMNDFSRIGANVNAFTTYSETVYYFSCCGDLEEPLNMLLDFVYDFSVSEESVEKEKGIIVEEVNMYLTNPITRLLNESYRSMYLNFPLKYDIGGSEETVLAITKEELEECYRINYHPSNMVLVVASHVAPDKVIEIIQKNFESKHFVKEEVPEIIIESEPEEVAIKNHSFSMDVACDKEIIAYKLKPDFKDEKDAFRKQSALTFLLEASFTAMNPLYQKWLDEGLVNDFFGYEVDFMMDYAYVLFYIESDKKDSLKKIIEEGLKTENVNEDVLNQLKRKYIGIGFSNLNQLEGFTLDYLKDYLEGMDFFDEIEILRSITLKDVKNSIDFVEKSSISVTRLEKKSQ